MATTIVTKYGGDAPAASDIVRGELAVDTENGRLYTENAAGAVVEIGLNPEGNVDVTGSVTADGLTVTGTLGNWSIDSQGAVQTFTRNSTSYIRASDASGALRFDTGGSNARLNIAANGDISFYEDTGTTPKLVWSASAESLSVPTLSITDGSITTTAAAGDHTVFNSTGADADFRVRTGANTHSLFVEGNTGNVGIGTASPSSVTHLVDDTSTVYDATAYQSDLTIERKNTSGSNQSAHIRFNVTGYEGSTTGEASIGAVQTANASSADIVFTTRNAGTRGERMRIDASGQLRLSNSTPTWDTTFSSLVTKGGFIGSQSSSYLYNGQNVYYNGGFKYSTAAAVTLYEQSFGAHTFYNAASGTAGAAVTLTPAMKLDASGNLLVSDTTANPSGDNVDSGIALHNAGLVRASTNNAAAPLDLNVKGRDGTIAEFRKDGTTVGSIGIESGGFVIDGEAGHTGIRFGAAQIIPRDNGADTNGLTDLGFNGGSFKDLYLSGGVFLGGTGAVNKLDDYEEGTWTPTTAGDATGVITGEVGQYTKIGRLVQCQCQFQVTTNFTSSGIDGLPFTPVIAATLSNQYGSYAVNTDGTGNVFFRINDAGTSANFKITTGLGGTDHLPNTTNNVYRFCFTYETAA